MRQPEEASPAPASGRIVLGRIVGFHGVRGWVKVHSDTVPRENILDYTRWQLSKGGESSVVQPLEGGRSGKSLIARLDGFNDREQAATLIGSDICVSRDDLPALSANEFYWADLVGCSVCDLSGTRFGEVLRLFETGANDVVVVRDQRGEAHGAEILIPWVRPDVIVSIDLDARLIRVDWDPDY